MNTTTTITKHAITAAARAVTLAASLAAASQVQAQTLDQTGPLGPVGWSEAATFCKVLPNSAASSFNYVLGTVGFAGTSHGTIGLACPMPGIMNGLTPASINAFAVEFLNPAGSTGGCTIGAYFVDRTAGQDSGWTTGQTFANQVWTANIGLSNLYPLDPGHTYEVDVYLYRPATAVGLCNPTLYSAFMEEVIL